MNVKRPHMHILPTFEAAARHLSFKKAAEELHVTPSAISQQIKQLELMLGIELFLRSTRKVALSEAGESFYHVARSTIAHYDDEFRKFTKNVRSPPLRISTVPYIAYDILIPNLHAFTESNPDCELVIETSERVVDFDDPYNTVAVRIGNGNWPGMHSRLLAPMHATLAGSPKLVASFSLNSLSSLKKAPLISVRSGQDEWARASELLNTDLTENKKVVVDNYLSAVAAAEQGMGIMIAMLPITRKRINQGSLLPLSGKSVEVKDRGFYFAQYQGIEDNSRIERLYQWLTEVFEKLQSSQYE